MKTKLIIAFMNSRKQELKVKNVEKWKKFILF